MLKSRNALRLYEIRAEFFFDRIFDLKQWTHGDEAFLCQSDVGET